MSFGSRFDTLGSQLCEWLVESKTCDPGVERLSHFVRRLREHPEGIMICERKALVHQQSSTASITEATEEKTDQIAEMLHAASSETVYCFKVCEFQTWLSHSQLACCAIQATR